MVINEEQVHLTLCSFFAMFRSFKIATGKWKHHSLVIMETIIIFQLHGSPYQVLLRHRDACKKKQEGITINTEELSTKRANLFQIEVFF